MRSPEIVRREEALRVFRAYRPCTAGLLDLAGSVRNFV